MRGLMRISRPVLGRDLVTIVIGIVRIAASLGFVWICKRLVDIVDDMNIPVICYGLRADVQGNLFEGSQWLMAWADTIEEVKTICWCGKKAIFNARFDAEGHVLKEGEQVVLGANDKYIGLCRRHWMRGDLGPDFKPNV